VGQLFGKFGFRAGDLRLWLTTALADDTLNGNGLQEQRLLAADRSSVYTKPDITRNRAGLLNLGASQSLGDSLSFSGNLYWRRIRTFTLNGDVNNDALDQALYQPNAAERAALVAAGFSGFPAAGESAANTAFPKWRCIAQALLVDEPAEKCNGLINRSSSRQSNFGLSGQLGGDARWAGVGQQWVIGAAFDQSRVHFAQGTELGYLGRDHGVVGVGAFGDGVTGGTLDGVPYDTRVDLSARTRTWSLFGSDVMALDPRTHLTLSGRYNRSKVTNRDAITPGGGAGSLDGDHRFSRFNPALGLTFAATPGVTAYAGINQGSRSPSAVELGCADPDNPCKLPNAMAGDPPLRQVVTTTVEAGLRGTREGTAWNIGVFRADNRDDILFVADNAAGFGYFRNFGKTRRQGLEAGVSTRISGASMGANFTLLDATFRSAEVLGGVGNSSNDAAQAGFPGVEGRIELRPGDRIPLIPRHLLKVFAELPLGTAFSLGLDATAIGGAFARGNENNAHVPDGTYYLASGRSAGHAVLNLNGEWRPARGLTIFAQLNNAFDRRYDSAAQLGVTAFDASGRFVARPFPANANGDRPLVGSTFLAPGAPRSVNIGLRYAL
jgi:outer membrane receptor protein involved in Fe transport